MRDWNHWTWDIQLTQTASAITAMLDQKIGQDHTLRPTSQGSATDRYLYGRSKKNYHVPPPKPGSRGNELSQSLGSGFPNVAKRTAHYGWKEMDGGALDGQQGAPNNSNGHTGLTEQIRNFREEFQQFTKTPIDVYKKKPRIRAPLLLPTPPNFAAEPFHDSTAETEDLDAKGYLSMTLEQTKKALLRPEKNDCSTEPSAPCLTGSVQRTHSSVRGVWGWWAASTTQTERICS